MRRIISFFEDRLFNPNAGAIQLQFKCMHCLDSMNPVLKPSKISSRCLFIVDATGERTNFLRYGFDRRKKAVFTMLLIVTVANDRLLLFFTELVTGSQTGAARLVVVSKV